MRILHLMLVGAMLATMLSCAMFSPGSGGPMSASLQERSNGYVLMLPSTEHSTDLSAFVTGGRWVIITIADPAFPELTIEDIPSAVIDSFEVSRFPSATQIALHFAEAIRGVEAVRSSDNEQLQIAVFLQNPKGRRRD